MGKLIGKRYFIFGYGGPIDGRVICGMRVMVTLGEYVSIKQVNEMINEHVLDSINKDKPRKERIKDVYEHHAVGVNFINEITEQDAIEFRE